MAVPVKNKERRFRNALAVYLAIIALLAFLDRWLEFMMAVGMVAGPYGVLNLSFFRLLDQCLLIIVGIALTWSVIAFVSGQLKEIKSNQVELKPRTECREYPVAGSLDREDTPLAEVTRQWNAARDYAAKHPEDAEHWQGRMQQIIARSSQMLIKYFETLTDAELEKERTFVDERLAGARADKDTEARIRWKAVVSWIDDAKDLKKSHERHEIPTTGTPIEQDPSS